MSEYSSGSPWFHVVGGYFDGDTDVVIGDPPLLLSIGPIPEHSHVTHLVKSLVVNNI